MDETEFTQHLNQLKQNQSPDKLINHFQQMQDDLSDIRYLIQQHYFDVVEIPGL